MTLYRNNIGLFCNGCGKAIPQEKGIPLEDSLLVEKTWGYFSSRDGRKIRFRLCEDCVDKMTKDFAVPPEESEETELFPSEFLEEV